MNTNPLTPSEIAQRLDTILASILLLVAACHRIIGAKTVPLWNRISRSRRRLGELLAHLAAGRLPRIRTARVRANTPRIEPNGAPAIPIPGRPLWLVIQLGYRAAGFGSQLNHLLHEPGVAETLATYPGAARTLRPLCRMLGVTPPPALQLPPRPPKAPASRQAEPTVKAATKPPQPAQRPRLPLLPQRKPRPMPYLYPDPVFRRS